jgi:GPI ethanolamine phosphate transferase 2/3 subunit F
MFSSRNESTLFILSITLAELISSTLIIHLIVILFGASLNDFINTFLFSLFLSLICVMPAFILIEHSNPVDFLFRLLIKQEFHNNTELKCFIIAKGTIIGSWFGALVIPLDWDRWWQAFPISCFFGALIGILLAGLYILFKFKNKIKHVY